MSSTINPTMVVRRAEPADVPKLEAFYQRFHSGRTRLLNMKTWHWEFLDNPNSRGNIPFFVIEAEGAIHGGIGYLPVNLQCGDHTVTAGHPVNYFVDPAFKGLPALRLMRACLRESTVTFFSYLTDDAVRLVKATGVVDLSTHLSHYYLALGSHVGRIAGGWRGYAKLLALRLARVFLLNAARVYCTMIGGRWETAVQTQIPSLPERSMNTNFSKSRYAVVKDAAYLHWRYALSPLLNCSYVTVRENGTVTALAVVHMDHKLKTAAILDIIQVSPNFACSLQLIIAVIDHCRAAGATMLSTHLIHAEIEPAFRWLGFGRQPSDHHFMVYAEDKALKAALSDASKWEFFLGDTDVY